MKFRKKLKLQRLRDSEVKEEFAEGFNNKCDGNEDWCGLKGKLLDVASEVCGYTVKPVHSGYLRFLKKVSAITRCSL